MLFILPALLISVGVILIPAILTILMAFLQWDGMTTPSWTGLDNFRAVLADPIFFRALVNNLKWMTIFLVVAMALGLLAGAMLLTVKRGRTFFQVIFFLPMVIATVIIARIWQGMIYHPETGVLGWLHRFGFAFDNPLADPATSLYAAAGVDLWHYWGFLAIIFFGALRQVDASQIEAARVDGAGFFQLLRYVLVPAVRPTIALMAVMLTIWSFLAFDFVYVLTGGGPAYSSELLSTLSYRYAFYSFAIGPAAAVAVFISLFGMIAAVAYIWIQRREIAR